MRGSRFVPSCLKGSDSSRSPRILPYEVELETDSEVRLEGKGWDDMPLDGVKWVSGTELNWEDVKWN
jgi:ABC-type transport system substrate-binding protein